MRRGAVSGKNWEAQGSKRPMSEETFRPLERPIRVLHVLDGLPGGGVEDRLREMLALHDRNRFEFAVCHLGAGFTFEEDIRTLGVPVLSIRESPIHGLIPEPNLFFRLIQVVREFCPDVMHVHLHAAYFYGAVVARIMRVRGVVYTVSVLKDQCPWWFFPVLFRLFRWGFDVFFTPRPQELIQYAGVDPNKIVNFGGFIDSDSLSQFNRTNSPVITEFGLSDSFPIILTAGRFVPMKGFVYAIEAVKGLTSRFPQLKLIILGEGDQEPELRRCVCDNRLTNYVVMPGFRKDIFDFYAAADIYVRAGVIEGANRASYLAMVHGVPTAAFDTGAVSEALTDEVTGLLVPNRDVHALAEAIVRLAENEELRHSIGRNGREFVVKERDIRTTIAVLETIYGKLGSPDRCPRGEL